MNCCVQNQDMNMLQINEFLSRSSIPSPGLRPTLCRNCDYSMCRTDAANISYSCGDSRSILMQRVCPYKLRHSDVGPFPQQRISLHSRPILHLFATLENSSNRSPRTRYQNQTMTGTFEAPGLFDALQLGAVEDPASVIETQFIIGLDLAASLSSPFPSCVLFRHRLLAASRAEIADVEQTEKMVPLITCEMTFG